MHIVLQNIQQPSYLSFSTNSNLKRKTEPLTKVSTKKVKLENELGNKICKGVNKENKIAVKPVETEVVVFC